MSRLPASVLFVCNLNQVRSPMAAGLMRKLYGPAVVVDSGGLEPSQSIDPLVVAVMQEIGVDLSDFLPRSFAEVRPPDFEVIVALSEEAWLLLQAAALPSEHWPTPDPTTGEGSREMRLEAYRITRKALEKRIVDRFGAPSEWA